MVSAEKASSRKPRFSSFNILALDGGGVRGVIEGIIIQRLLKINPGFIRDTDLLIGTSIGGIQALSLAAGHDPVQSVEIYEKCAKFIFSENACAGIRDGWRLFGAAYNNSNLRDLLTMEFGDMALGDLDKRVAIVTFDLDNNLTGSKNRSWQPKIFHNLMTNPCFKEKVVDVALRTTAAPLFFPTVDGYVDGAIVANSPGMVGLTFALDRKTGLNKPLDEIKLLALGSGRNGQFIKGENLNWGLTRWAPYLMTMIMDGQKELVDFQCRQILKDNYFRADPKLEKTYSLDSWESVKELATIAEEFDLTSLQLWINGKWR